MAMPRLTISDMTAPPITVDGCVRYDYRVQEEGFDSVDLYTLVDAKTHEATVYVTEDNTLIAGPQMVQYYTPETVREVTRQLLEML